MRPVGNLSSDKLLIDIGEYGLHALLEQQINANDDRVVGDDCAIYDVGGGELVLVNVDKLPGGVPMAASARLCVVQALSDIVCMGGRPQTFLVALTLPRETSVREFSELIHGLRAEMARYGAMLIGGDTKEGDAFHMVGIAMGRARADAIVRRVGARPGMVVGVTSTRKRRWGRRWAHFLIEALSLAVPDDARAQCRDAADDIELPVAESMAIVATGHARAGLDLSDGVGSGIRALARASAVGIELSGSALTQLIDPRLTPVATAMELPISCFALSPGYEWENLYVVDAEGVEAVAEAADSVGGRFTPIGSVIAEERLMIDGHAFPPEAWPNGEKFVRAYTSENQFEAWRQACRAMFGALG